MRVFFVGDVFDGCYYVRCLLPLRENKWDGTRTSLNEGTKDPQLSFSSAINSDVIVFHRPLDKRKFYASLLLKLRGKKIVFDNDDTYKENSGTPMVMVYGKSSLIKKANNLLTTFASKADLVTLSTKFLANEYLEYNKRIEILPNFIDENDWGEPEEKNNDKVRIGIVGSVLNTGDFFVIKDVIPKLISDDRIQIVLFGINKDFLKNKKSLIYKIYKNEFSFWEKFLEKIEWHSSVKIKDYFDYLKKLKLDIALIPRKDNYFNRCKSNVKFLEMSMVETMCIVQGFDDNNSPYEQNKEDTKYEVVIKDNSKWLDVINYYVENERERKEMARKAREYVVKNYSIKNNAYLWKLAYLKLF